MKNIKRVSSVLVLFLFFATLVACHSSARPQYQTANQAPLKEMSPYTQAIKVAKAAVESGNPTIAERSLKAAHELMPSATEPVVLLGKLYLNTGQYQRVLQWSQPYLKQFKNKQVISELYRQVGLAYLYLKQPRLALNSLVQAYPNAESPDFILNDIAVVLDQMSQHCLARQCYQRGLQIAADHRDVILGNYALSLAAVGELEGSQQLLSNTAFLQTQKKGLLENRRTLLQLIEKAMKHGHGSNPSPSVMREIKRQFALGQPYQALDRTQQKEIADICVIGRTLNQCQGFPG